MTCFHPIHGYRAPGGTVKFSRSGAYTDRPLTINCGQCRGCRLERSRQWAVRCMHEAQMHERNSFITLTYDNTHLPEDWSLKVEHWQLFAKAFRNHLTRVDKARVKENIIKPKEEFRFFHCGEYGEVNNRPHYHAAIFSQDFSHDRVLDKTTKHGHPLYTSETLSTLWPHGKHWIGELTFESAAYVARYIMKKVTGPHADDHYNWMSEKHEGLINQRKPEYTTMSRKPGIGHSWIKKYLSDVYPSDQVIINGKSTNPPKYYDQIMEQIDPVKFRDIQTARMKEGIKHEENNTPDRLSVRETIFESRIKQLTREI